MICVKLFYHLYDYGDFKAPQTSEFTNRVNLGEVAHDKLLYFDLQIYIVCSKDLTSLTFNSEYKKHFLEVLQTPEVSCLQFSEISNVKSAGMGAVAAILSDKMH